VLRTHCCPLDTGQLTSAQRAKVLDEINTNNDMRIILMSLKVGGQGKLSALQIEFRLSCLILGMTLTMCNRVILVDPAWNPAKEEQAYDRVYRIGQTKPVSFYRLLVEDTVECERVVPVSGLYIS
jgi:SNF2 family DNA or RNA helicase